MGTVGYKIRNSLTQKRNSISNIVRAIGYVPRSKCGLMMIIQPQKGPDVAPDTGFFAISSSSREASSSWLRTCVCVRILDCAHKKQSVAKRRQDNRNPKKTDICLRQFSSLSLPCHVTLPR